MTWREDRTRRREEREQAEAEADAMLRSTASGREFVAVKQPDKTLELAEIIVDRDNNENEEDEENEEDDESNENQRYAIYRQAKAVMVLVDLGMPHYLKDWAEETLADTFYTEADYTA